MYEIESRKKQQIQQGKDLAFKVADVAPKVWWHKDKIIEGGKRM